MQQTTATLAPFAHLTRDARQRTLKEARVFYADRAISTKVLMRDLAPGGCRLKLITDVLLPDRFEIETVMGGRSAWCQVRWRRGNEVGVAFDEPLTASRSGREQRVMASDLSTMASVR